MSGGTCHYCKKHECECEDTMSEPEFLTPRAMLLEAVRLLDANQKTAAAQIAYSAALALAAQVMGGSGSVPTPRR